MVFSVMSMPVAPTLEASDISISTPFRPDREMSLLVIAALFSTAAPLPTTCTPLPPPRPEVATNVEASGFPATATSDPARIWPSE